MEASITSYMSSLDVLRENGDAELSLALQNNSALRDALEETESHGTRQDLTLLACKTIQSCLGSSVKMDTDAEWNDTNRSQSAWLIPRCVVYPRSAQDVSRVIKILSLLRTPFEVKCRGLSPTPDSTDVLLEDGVLIDLKELNGIEISKDGKVASVGPGASWNDVYKALDGHGVTLVGPRLPHVGIGDFILGGGLSYLSGEHGLGADNVDNFEIVLADGLIADANQAEHPDLFWALKGGGSNFGIVTRFDLRTVPVTDIWYSISTYAITEVPELLLAFERWQLTAADPKAAVFFQMGLDSCTLTLVYCAPAKMPLCFKLFYGIEVMEYLILPTNGTMLKLNEALAKMLPCPQGRYDNRTTCRKNDLGLYSAIESYWIWRKETIDLKRSAKVDVTFTIQHVPKTLAENTNNPLGLKPVLQQWWTISAEWSNSSDDDVIFETTQDIISQWKELGVQQGTHVDFESMTDAAADQNPIRCYGDVNLQKLKGVSTKYDKAQVFQKLQKGPFRLAEA